MALEKAVVDNQASEIYSGGLRMLTPTEQTELEQYETVIEKGLQTFYDVGMALLAIREKGLFAQTHRTFEEYFKDRWGDQWGMHISRAYQLMDAAMIVENLSSGSTMVELPHNERQARPLRTLEPEQQREVWKIALETAPEGKITSRHVQDAVNDYFLKTSDVPPMPAPFRNYETEEAFHRHQREVPNQTVNNIRPGLQPLMTSDSPEWYTPEEIIDRVVRVLVGIDLDPCSNDKVNPNVPAEYHYTHEDDGLSKAWFGNVYMNPPYGREIKEWVAKLVMAYEGDDVSEAIALLPARTDTAWMRMLSDYPRCFVWGRLNFSEHDNSAPFPSVVVYLGENISRFAEIFSDIGDIYVKWRG